MKRLALILMGLVWLAGLSWPAALALADDAGADVPPPTTCAFNDTSPVPVPGPAVSVTLTPLQASIVIPAEGGSYQYDAMIVNHSATVQSFNVQMVIEGPGVARTLASAFITLQPGQSTKQVVANQVVPAAAPAGSYVHTITLVAPCAGADPCATAEPCTTGVIHSDGFRWEKEARREPGV